MILPIFNAIEELPENLVNAAQDLGPKLADLHQGDLAVDNFRREIRGSSCFHSKFEFIHVDASDRREPGHYFGDSH